MKKRNIDFEKIELLEGFWKQRYDLNRKVTLHAVYEQFKSSNRIDALLFHFDENEKLHFYYDSDTAKWIEALSDLILKYPNDYAEYEAVVDSIAQAIERNNLDGYLNSYFIQKEPDKIYTDRTNHELYCLGHLIEAAIAYDRATGKGLLLRLCEKAVDHAIRAFVTEKTAKFVTGGHEEIELALIKLYRYTGKQKYLDFGMHFLNERGRHDETLYDFTLPAYDQSNQPVRELERAEGHAVRATYLYIAMADAAAETGDEALLAAAERLFDNITERRMYVTGGIGSGSFGENFTSDYDLPNLHAYSESCAAIGFALFGLSMQQTHDEAKYADAVERVLYNAMLSPVSLDGKSFFYENPLEIELTQIDKDKSVKHNEHLPITHRVQMFECSCCPPNLARIYARIADFIYSERANVLFVNQYIASEYGEGEKFVRILTDFPAHGKVTVQSRGWKEIRIREPFWCDEVRADAEFTRREGYLVFSGDRTVNLDFGMPVYFAEVNPAVRADHGKVALMRGPVVYCAEGIDNGNGLGRISVDTNAKVSEAKNDAYLLPDLILPAFRDRNFDSLYRKAKGETDPIRLRMIPYYTFANREVCDMRVFLRKP